MIALLQERDDLPVELCGGDQAAEVEMIPFVHLIRVPVKTVSSQNGETPVRSF